MKRSITTCSVTVEAALHEVRCVTCAVFVVLELGVSQQSDSFRQTERLKSFDQTFHWTSTQLDANTHQTRERRCGHAGAALNCTGAGAVGDELPCRAAAGAGRASDCPRTGESASSSPASPPVSSRGRLRRSTPPPAGTECPRPAPKPPPLRTGLLHVTNVRTTAERLFDSLTAGRPAERPSVRRSAADL